MWQSRIAPTPSGFLHIGNAFNFLLTSELAQLHGGSLRLRIDDLDTPRVRTEYVQDVFDTLAWLGIPWQAGAANMQEQQTIYTQQQRLERYHQLTDLLIATGRVYACTCSRANQGAEDPCQHLSLPYNTPGSALKMMVPSGVVTITDRITGLQSIDIAATMGNFVIRRKDHLPSYQVASLADDIDFGITAIVRGMDLIASTAAQLYLANLLGEEGFVATSFYHHPLIMDGEGGKLSKSAGSASMNRLRKEGVTAEEVKARYRDWRRGFDVF